MREILFRGKRKVNEEWVHGFPFVSRKGEYKIKWYDPEYGSAKTSEVYPETVGQFTGLLDKNGKKIFEGDIICFRGKEWVGYKEVFWGKSDFQWRLRNKHISGGSRELELDDEEWGEVVGNIHDNPELLG